MRLRYFCGALLFAAFCSLPSAFAQAEFDIGLGFGTAHDASNHQGIDNLNSINALGPCTPNSGDVNCQQTPALSNFFMGFGMNILLTKRYGFGGDVIFQPERPSYGPLLYRQTFYDFNGIYAPINQKRVQLEILGGIGGAHTGFSINQTGCVGIAACSSQIVPVATANHFAIHVGAAVQVFVTEHIFVRPEYDFRYVPGLGTPSNFNAFGASNTSHQFNSDVVNAFMVWVGFGWH